MLRIIDANLNRAREGLRVMEDVARFHLNRGDLCESLKSIRHGLQSACRAAGLDELALLAARDTPGDVGTTIKTGTELARGSLADAALAAGKRAGEALRAIEESLKVRGGSPDASAGVERLRYTLYDVEKRLMAAMAPRVPPTASVPVGRADRPCPQWRLCVLITESLCKLPWWQVAQLARRGGADCLQLREKDLSAAELLRRARQLVEIATDHDGPDDRAIAHGADPTPVPPCHVIINDRPDVAIAAGAHGVHLGRDDMPIAEARRIVGPRLWIGASTHMLQEAREAAGAGADYCGVGAMFAGTTKARPPSGPAYLKQYLADRALAALPHLAIGGISAENLTSLRKAGCRGVAVSSAVCASAEPGSVCRELRTGLGA